MKLNKLKIKFNEGGKPTGAAVWSVDEITQAEVDKEVDMIREVAFHGEDFPHEIEQEEVPLYGSDKACYMVQLAEDVRWIRGEFKEDDEQYACLTEILNLFTALEKEGREEAKAGNQNS